MQPSLIRDLVYALALIISLPLVASIIRAVYSAGSLAQGMKRMAASIATLTEELKTFRHDVRDVLQEHEVRITVVERRQSDDDRRREVRREEDR